MFLKEALLRCAEVEETAASVYADLAAVPGVRGTTASGWAECGRREEAGARLLRALARVSEALGDEGPFLVQVPVQLSAIERTTDACRRAAGQADDEESAQRCAQLLDAAPRADLHASLLEVVEPEARRVVRLIASEIKATRRWAGARARAREGTRSRASCTNPAG